MTNSFFNKREAAQIARDPDALNSVMRRTSRYVSGGETEVSDWALEWWERAVFNTTENDDEQYYVVEQNLAGELRLISELFYNTEANWWIIAQMNNILDPYGEVTPGVVLRIPSTATVDQIMQGRLGGIASKREVQPLQIVPIV